MGDGTNATAGHSQRNSERSTKSGKENRLMYKFLYRNLSPAETGFPVDMRKKLAIIGLDDSFTGNMLRGI